METEKTLTLQAWLDRESVSYSEMSRRVGIGREAVRRHAKGLRTPRPEEMRAYFDVTQQQVEPNSFFDLSPKTVEVAA